MTSFRRWWLAASVDAFGTWLLVMAVPLEVYRRTGSTTSTGLALAVGALPAVLIGPWAGVMVDRWPRGRLLIAANLAAAAGVALMLTGHLSALYLALLAENVALCFIQPAMTAVLPAITGDLAMANAQMMTTTSVFRLLGPPAGTLLAAHGRFGIVVAVDVASYVAAAAIIATVRVPAVVPTAAVRLRAGLRLIAASRSLRSLLVSTTVFWTANAALTVLLIPFVTGRLDRAGSAVGYLIAGLGCGYLCGSAVSKDLITRYGVSRLLPAAYAMVGLCFLVLFTTTRLSVALAAVTLSGVPGAVAAVAAQQWLQTVTPADALGRVSAAFLAGHAVAAVAGAAAAGVLVAATGPVVAPIVGSSAVLIAAVAAIPASGSARRPG